MMILMIELTHSKQALDIRNLLTVQSSDCSSLTIKPSHQNGQEGRIDEQLSYQSHQII